MDPSALAQLEHENWIAHLATTISLSRNGLVVRDRGIVAALGHVPMRFFNQILVEDSSAPAAAIAAAVSLGREREDAFVVSLRDDVDRRFTPLMADLGLVAATDAATQAMTMHPLRERAAPAEPPSGFEIERVIDASGLDDHRGVVTVGFDADPAIAPTMIGLELVERPECAMYVGYLDGQPVTTGLGWRTGRTIGVYNIATLPTARRRGFGAAMTARVVADGGEAGCDVAALQASVMGRPIYERLGFRLSVRYTGYVDPTAGGV